MPRSADRRRQAPTGRRRHVAKYDGPAARPLKHRGHFRQDRIVKRSYTEAGAVVTAAARSAASGLNIEAYSVQGLPGMAHRQEVTGYGDRQVGRHTTWVRSLHVDHHHDPGGSP